MLNAPFQGSVAAQTAYITDVPLIDYGWSLVSVLSSTAIRQAFAAMDIIRERFLGNNEFAKKYVLAEQFPGNTYTELIKTYNLTMPYLYQEFGIPASRYADLLFLQDRVTTFYHLSSTVALGKATDMEGNINGVENLSVCDSILLPDDPDGNPTTTLYAICRKLAGIWSAED